MVFQAVHVHACGYGCSYGSTIFVAECRGRSVGRLRNADSLLKVQDFVIGESS